MNKLETLTSSLKNFKISGPKNVSVLRITSDSRKVKKGYLFVAVKGINFDGHDFISDAVKRGASVVVGEKEIKIKGATYVKVEDSKEALGQIASAWWGNPSKKLRVIGVTGTDGKTTTSHMIYNILVRSEKRVGLVSTIGAEINGKTFETGLHVTNPDPLSVQKFLAKMVEEKCEYAVLEVTSHGIDQKRIAGVDFEIGVLTNITHEHLDYHETFENYRDTKVGFLAGCKSLVLNKDDESYDYVVSKIKKANKLKTYSIKKDGDFKVDNIKENSEGMLFDVEGYEQIKMRIEGSYNVSNALAAIATVSLLGIGWDDIKDALYSFKLPRGRMEKIEMGQEFEVYVDFAHTPNALRSVLSHLSGKKKGRLIVVFGCAGERDSQKRSHMGKISARYADISVFTAEDPRSEDIFEILEKMAMGAKEEGAKEVLIKESPELKVPKSKHWFIKIPEREEAMAFALGLAKKGDTVIFCGKGHEKSMAYKGVEHPWSDFEVAKNILSKDDNLAAVVMAAGKGKRMHSKLPKVLHEIAGRPILSYTLENLRKAKFGKIVMVVGFKAEDVVKRLGGAVEIARQPKRLGTADAVSKGLGGVPGDLKLVVALNGDDSAFYKPQTIKDVVATHKKSGSILTFVTLIKDNPFGLGRIVRDFQGNILGIVEEKDATSKEKKINEVNDGFYVFDRVWLERSLPKIKKSPQGEYYLVDLIKMAIDEGKKVTAYRLKDAGEWFGINTPQELGAADKKMRERLL